MPRIYVNGYSSSLAASASDSATALTVSSATGLPTLTGSQYYYLTLDTLTGTTEIVKVTARTGTTLTVEREQEGTSGVAWSLGSLIELRETAESYTPEAVISGQSLTSATVATGDLVLIQDISDSNNLKSVTAQSIADLSSVTKTGTTKLVAGGNSTASGYIELLEDTDSGSNKLTLTPQQAMASDRTITFPDASGTALVTGQAINSVPSITFSSTSGIIGTTTNDSAASGSVGEYMEAIVQYSSHITMTSTVAMNITYIDVPAGDWLIVGNVTIALGGTATNYIAWTDTASATIPESEYYNRLDLNGGSSDYWVAAPAPRRYSFSTTTRVYLSARSAFTGSGFANGRISAWRVR